MKASLKPKKSELRPATVNKVALAALTKDLLNFTSRLEKSRSKTTPTSDQASKVY